MKLSATLVQTRWKSPLGPIILAASSAHLHGLWFDGQRHQPDATDWQVAADGHPLLALVQTQLGEYFSGQRSRFNLPLDLEQGTPFQQAVWHGLLAIPFGATCSYGRLSADIGLPAAVRAVGAAIGRNPLSLVVPCHRVVGTKGALTGYAGGLDRKAALLQLEAAL
ncbi:MAG: methylated-DNA-[protein]-cysteine S-methyltransferase [Rhodoferax sp.]|jgi:methylated-DNA-[protein]-cysteine S-methyltransferase